LKRCKDIIIDGRVLTPRKGEGRKHVSKKAPAARDIAVKTSNKAFFDMQKETQRKTT